MHLTYNNNNNNKKKLSKSTNYLVALTIILVVQFSYTTVATESCKAKDGKIFNNKCYFVPKDVYTTQCGCQHYCNANGENGTLACIDSEEHLKWIGKNFQKNFLRHAQKGYIAWVGLYKSKYTEKKKHPFSWVSQQCNTTISSSNSMWMDGEPSDHGADGAHTGFEPCVGYIYKRGLVDHPCGLRQACICQQDSTFTSKYISLVDNGYNNGPNNEKDLKFGCSFDDRDPFQTGSDMQLIATIFFLAAITAFNFFFCLPTKKNAENGGENDVPIVPRKIDTVALNGLRGIVAMHIALGHYSGFGLGIDLIGGASLPLFYLLSGYIMTIGYGSKLTNPSSRQRNLAKPLNRKRFMVNRVARLCPLYWCTNICCCVCTILFVLLTFGGVFAMDCDNGAGACLDPLANFFMSLTLLNVWVRPFNLWIPRGGRVDQPSNGVTWTMQTMFMFYVVFPYVIPWLASLRKRIKNLSVAIELLFYMQLIIFFSIVDFGLFYLHNVQFAYWTARSYPPSRLPVFMMGCVLALRSMYGNENDSVRIYCTCCCKSNMKKMANDDNNSNGINPVPSPENIAAAKGADRISLCILVTVLLSVILTLAISMELNGVFRVLWEAIFPIFFAQLMVDLTNAGKTAGIVNRICRSKFGIFIGRISMALYLIHMIVVAPVLSLIWTLPFIIKLIALIITFLCGLAIAYVITVYIEDPCRRCIRQDKKNQQQFHNPQTIVIQPQQVMIGNAGNGFGSGTLATPFLPTQTASVQPSQNNSSLVHPVTIPQGM